MKLKINRDQHKIWVIFALFSIIGFLLGIFGPIYIPKLTRAKYDRSALEQIMKDYLGHANFSGILTKESLVVAYDYNSQQPRFYSRYYSRNSPSIYQVSINNATQASSAAPTFFDPTTNINKYGLVEYQIDGGIICNNPALYAYEMAVYLYNINKNDVTMISLGTGEKDYD